MPASLRPGAEPFYFAGGSTGALLIHGFTGATRDMRALGQALNDDGLTALGVRLAHHGTHADDMNRSRWQDWYASALDGYHLLCAQCERVVVVGISMGGMLGLRLAAHLPVAGIVTMSTPTYLFYRRSGLRPHVAGLYSLLFRFVVKQGVEVNDYTAGYPVFPTHAVGEFYALLKETDPLLSRIRVPVLLIHSRADAFIPPENMPYLYDRLSNAPREMFWLYRSAHVITRDTERETLFEHIRAWVRQHVLQAQ